MSRLQETKTTEGTPGWQWDDGPIFIGDEARTQAVNYGRGIRYLEELTDLARMQHEQDRAKRRFNQLEKIRDERARDPEN